MPSHGAGIQNSIVAHCIWLQVYFLPHIEFFSLSVSMCYERLKHDRKLLRSNSLAVKLRFLQPLLSFLRLPRLCAGIDHASNRNRNSFQCLTRSWHYPRFLISHYLFIRVKALLHTIKPALRLKLDILSTHSSAPHITNISELSIYLWQCLEVVCGQFLILGLTRI